MVTEILLVAVFPALLVAAAVWDLISFTIPNLLIAAMLTLFVVFLSVMALEGAGMGWTDTGLHLLSGVVGLAAGVALFATGWVGGGDAKLFAATALWLGWNTLFEYTLLASILGGGLTLAVLALRRVPLPAILARQGWILRLADKEAGVPYGIALVVAALVVLPRTELFRLAVGG